MSDKKLMSAAELQCVRAAHTVCVECVTTNLLAHIAALEAEIANRAFIELDACERARQAQRDTAERVAAVVEECAIVVGQHWNAQRAAIAIRQLAPNAEQALAQRDARVWNEAIDAALLAIEECFPLDCATIGPEEAIERLRKLAAASGEGK